jgi:crossover junction endodeoxyribonuclease RuvC
MRILAIDPGYERLGTAILEKTPKTKENVLYSACFMTSKTLEHSERLNLVGHEIERLIDLYKPEALSIETLFFSKNQKTAMQVAETRGVILFAAKSKGLSIQEFSPVQIKIAVTGYGKSDKSHMMAMIPRLVELKHKIKYDDEFDAIAAGITYFAHSRSLSTT